jgi:hypothetical protein
MVKSKERWIIRINKTRVCDRNYYTHVLLTLYTYPTHLVISCITIRLASPVRPWKKRQKVPPHVVRKSHYKVLLYVVKSLECWIIRNHKTRVGNQNDYTHVLKYWGTTHICRVQLMVRNVRPSIYEVKYRNNFAYEPLFIKHHVIHTNSYQNNMLVSVVDSLQSSSRIVEKSSAIDKRV